MPAVSPNYPPKMTFYAGTKVAYANVAKGVTPVTIWASQWSVVLDGSATDPVTSVGTIITGPSAKGYSQITANYATTGPLLNPTEGGTNAIFVGASGACTVSV